ncbi:hypothetical protein D3C87_666430 [compost metagenome]
MALGVYKFYCDFRRMGDLEGVFISNPEDIKEAIGKTAYFGEVLGKHSDVWCELSDDMFTLVSDDPTVVDVIVKHKLSSGYNPLSYVDQDE